MSTDTATEHGHDTSHDGSDEHDWHVKHVRHWTDLQFVYLAIALAVITAGEVAASYSDLGPVFIPLLLVLMLIKFFSVVLFFMHLHFDNRWFGMLFYMGLGLAAGVYVATMFTFQFFVK